MKQFRLVTLLLASTLVLSGCSKGEFEPTLDVDSIAINLPTKPTYGGAIKTDGTYDYIDIYESSDFHGAVNYSLESGQIGLARMASYFNKKRETNPGGTVIVSSGDMWQGSAESNLTRGYMVTYSMNYMGFDSMSLGNHEFDWSAEWIEKNAAKADFPFLCANLTLKATNAMPSYIQKSTVVQKGDYKVGIIGTIGAGVEGSILQKSLEPFNQFAEEGSIVTEEAARLRSEEHCDVVIWTSHYDGQSLESRYGSLDGLGVDAVFGGHTHSTYSNISAGVPIQETKNYGEAIAHIQLKINKSTKEVSPVEEACVPDEAPHTLAGISENADIKSIIDQYNEYIEPIKATKLGKTDSDLKINGALGNVATKAMLDAAKKWAGSNNISGDMAWSMTNLNGGIRADIAQGTITYGDVYRSFPFDNELVLYKTTGKKIIEFYRARAFNTLGVCKEFEAINSIDGNKEYYIVTTDYVATSPNFKLKANENNLIHTGEALRDIVAKHISNAKKIKGVDYLAGSDHPEFKW